MSKVLYIGGFELPDKNAAAQRVIGIGNSLRDIGFEVVYLGVLKDLTVENTKNYNGFSYYEISYPKKITDWLKYLATIKQYTKIIDKERPTNIILYNFPAISMFFLMRYCKKKKIKLYADCTEWYESSGGFLRGVVKNLDVFLRMRVLHLKLNGLIVISKYLFDFYKKNHVKNLITIPPTFDTENKKYKKTNNSLLDKDSNKKIRLIYCGSPGGKSKDRLDLVFQTLSLFPTLHLNVIGITKIQYQELFLDAQEYQNIKFFGRVSHNKALSYIKDSDFTIFFRSNNLTNLAGFPTKFAESISIGTPVITNSSSNIADYYQNNDLGFLINNFSIESLKTVLCEVENLTRAEINQLKEGCRQMKVFDYRQFNVSLKNFFNSI